jgi:lipopolysaccharide biosynthesis protein
MKKIRPIAIYLPQFHPIKENDEWWGAGFTEWTKVTKAQPRFNNHYQPHLPADLGFYDLRLAETREAQAELAKAYGIEGFCYYHYWFNGKRVLEKPLNDVLQSKRPDFPFCICWANENWTRQWDGMDKEILLKQEYSFEDDRQHMEYLCKNVFNDRRYIRVDGKPVFIIYRPALFPDIKQTVKIWRDEATKQGIGELYLAYMQSFGQKTDPVELGFDAAIEFQPDFLAFPPKKKRTLLQKFLHFIGGSSLNPRDKLYDYQTVADLMSSRPKPSYKIFPSVFPMWDNSARRKEGATIIHGSLPSFYEKWLAQVIKQFKPYSAEENFIFINAWNEWAEGNHLEPCQQWGRAYLEATKNAIDTNRFTKNTNE